MNYESIDKLITRSMSDITGKSFSFLLRKISLLNDIDFLQENCYTSKNSDAILFFYKSLSSHVAHLKKHSHLDEQFSNTVLRFNWQHFSRNPEIIRSYSDFILHLVSLFPEFIPPIYEKLCSWLTFDNFEMEKDSPSQTDISHLENVHFAVNGLLVEICSLVPMSSWSLLSALTKFFPSQINENCPLKHYLSNMLQLTHRFPILRDGVISLVIQKLNSLDIELRAIQTNSKRGVNIEPHLNFIQQQNSNFVDEIRTFVKNNILSASVDSPEPTSLDSALKENDAINSKINTMHSTLFDFFEAAQNSLASLESVFTSVLIAFDEQILPLDGPLDGAANFCVFHLTNLHHSFHEKFIRLLIDRMANAKADAQKRKNCAHYLASFVVRTRFLRCTLVVKVYEILLCLASCLMNENEPFKMITAEQSQRSDLSLFYSVCESLFHIFSNRFSEISSSPDHDEQSRLLSRLVSSKLSPLQFCSRDTVLSFVSLALATSTLDCFPILLCGYRFFCLNRSNSLPSAHFPFSLYFDFPQSKAFFRRKFCRFPFASPLDVPSKERFAEFYVGHEDLELKARGWLENKASKHAESEDFFGEFSLGFNEGFGFEEGESFW